MLKHRHPLVFGNNWIQLFWFLQGKKQNEPQNVRANRDLNILTSGVPMEPWGVCACLRGFCRRWGSQRGTERGLQAHSFMLQSKQLVLHIEKISSEKLLIWPNSFNSQMKKQNPQKTCLRSDRKFRTQPGIRSLPSCVLARVMLFTTCAPQKGCWQATQRPQGSEVPDSLGKIIHHHRLVARTQEAKSYRMICEE